MYLRFALTKPDRFLCANLHQPSPHLLRYNARSNVTPTHDKMGHLSGGHGDDPKFWKDATRGKDISFGLGDFVYRASGYFKLNEGAPKHPHVDVDIVSMNGKKADLVQTWFLPPKRHWNFQTKDLWRGKTNFERRMLSPFLRNACRPVI